jgi:tellurite resistance protein
MSSQKVALEVQVLALLGWVDGKFDDAEHEASRRLLEGTLEEKELFAELDKMGSTLPARADVVAAVEAAPPEVARAAIKSGFLLARADGYLHEGEFAILLELAAAAGIPQADLNRIAQMDNLHQEFIALENLF